MSRKTPKTLVGHGIALLLKDRNIGTVDGTPTLTDWRKGRYALAMGTIETFNGVTGAFTATLTVGVPGNQEGNTFAVTGSLEALTWAPLEPGTRATHTSGTHTLTGETEIPAYACYVGTPVLTDTDLAWHEILPGDIVFTPGNKNPLTATQVFKDSGCALNARHVRTQVTIHIPRGSYGKSGTAPSSDTINIQQ